MLADPVINDNAVANTQDILACYLSTTVLQWIARFGGKMTEQSKDNLLRTGPLKQQSQDCEKANEVTLLQALLRTDLQVLSWDRGYAKAQRSCSWVLNVFCSFSGSSEPKFSNLFTQHRMGAGQVWLHQDILSVRRLAWGVVTGQVEMRMMLSWENKVWQANAKQSKSKGGGGRRKEPQ